MHVLVKHQSCYLLGLIRCSFRCLDIPKHFCLLVPKIPSIVLSGVKNCLLVGSWEIAFEMEYQIIN